MVFLLDVDNTLLDNDRVVEDLRTHLQTTVGGAAADQYFVIFEDLRRELGYADYLGALQRFRLIYPHATELLRLSLWLVDYPFPARLYPGALAVLAHLQQWGPTVIFSDGDVVFQPRKIDRSGLWQAVAGRVLIYIHKEQELADVARRYPAAHYVLVDDKVRILSAVKAAWGERVTTVFPRQGHYARDPALVARYPTPDCTIEHIGQLVEYDRTALLGAASPAPPGDHEERR
ncbi:MAG: hypothetical protein KatS3mg061_0624 [Dehalococcoidia bacterium]|nr:MAG: hypothetical protein KatS3mg061_0624 [Dehalococcoidia bacterium]